MRKMSRYLAVSAAVVGAIQATAGTAAAYLGDAVCLYCHGDENPYIADKYKKASYLMTGHKNMLRKVTPGTPLTGSDGLPYDSGIDWESGIYSDGIDHFKAYYIFGGWNADTPRIVNAGGSYVCGACHTTGYETADSGMEPFTAFPAIESIISGSGTELDPFMGGVEVGGSWQFEGVQCERCHGEAQNSDGDEPSHNGSTIKFLNDPVSGEPAINLYTQSTALCLECHTQDLPEYPGVAIGSHGNYGEDFDGHSHGSEFLNSPHARFAGLGLEIDNPSRYESDFSGYPKDCTVWYACTPTDPAATSCTSAEKEAACSAAGGTYRPNAGCVACHDVHLSTVNDTGQQQIGGAILRNCAIECHDPSSTQGPVDADGNPLGYRGFHDGLGGIAPDTQRGTNPEACITCHMTEKFASHLVRINTDPDYSPFKTEAEFETEGECQDEAGNPLSYVTKTDCMADEGHWLVLADTYQEPLDGGVFPAVALSVTEACIQCHDGSQPYVVALNKDALAQYAVGYHFGTPLQTSHTLGYHADFGPNAPQVCNDCHGYFDSADEVPYVDACLRCHGPGAVASHSTPLTAYEAQIIGYDYHGGSVAPSSGDTALLSWSSGPCFAVNLDASGNAPVMVAGWDLPGSVSDTCDANSATCTVTYGSAGNYDVTVHLADTTYRTVVVKAVDTGVAPTVAMTVANTGAAGGMTVELTDNGSESQACGTDQSLTGTVLWGDGASSTIDLATATVTPPHAYSVKGDYTVQYTVQDAAGRKKNADPVRITVPDVVNSTFNIAGTILKNGNPVPRATVYLQKNGSTLKMARSLDGTYSFTDVVNNDYTVKAVLYGTTYGPESVSNLDDGGPRDVDGLHDGTVTVNLQ